MVCLIYEILLEKQQFFLLLKDRVGVLKWKEVK